MRPRREQADDGLDELVPPPRHGARAVVALVVVLVLALAWCSPQLLRPSVWGGSGGGVLTTSTDPAPQALTTTLTDTASWTPFTVVAVRDVPGARAVDAWLVTGDDVARAEAGAADAAATVAEQVAAVVDDPAAARLPRRVASGGPAALLVLWAVDDCTALEDGVQPVVELRNVLGATTTDVLPSFSAPDPGLVGDPGAEGQGDSRDVCPGP